jgi:hypothetical protein
VTEEEKPDHGLLAMLKRALDPNPPNQETTKPLDIAPDIAPAEIEPEPQGEPNPVAEPEPEQPAKAVEPVQAESSRPVVPRLRTAVEIQDMILGAIATIPKAPKKGMVITVYGYSPWNAMVTFAPGSTDSATAATIQKVLDTVVDRLRPEIDIEIPKD